MPGTYSVDYMNPCLGCATRGATVYYTLDGSEPTADSATFVGARDGSIPVVGFMERGDAALVPSIRPSEEGNAMLGFGNYRTDTNNLAVCIKHLTREDASSHRHIPDIPEEQEPTGR